MTEESQFDIKLTGCTPEPLMSYLKALGVLRLVSEQKDEKARGWWVNGSFCLRSTLDQDVIVGFFLNKYKPTPIVVPWSGNDFFCVNWNSPGSLYSKTPTAENVVEAILATNTCRLEPYRNVLRACKASLEKCNIYSKKGMEKNKWAFIQNLRATCSEHLTVDWIDAAAVTRAERFAALLGSGGGSDGNTHFSDNFMQNLWDVLPDFDGQRSYEFTIDAGTRKWLSFVPPSEQPDCVHIDTKKNKSKFISSLPPDKLIKALLDRDAGLNLIQIAIKKLAVAAHSKLIESRVKSDELLSHALFGLSTKQLIKNRTSSLFDSGAVGGPNATQGMERDSVTNPWNIVLALEGTLCFSGSSAKRFGVNAPNEAVFPFQVSSSITSNNRLAYKEKAGKEIWLPLWNRPVRSNEMLTFLREGRAHHGSKAVTNGLDMARAIAELGVDRGISAFHRYTIVKGRVGGKNYNTAASLGHFEVAFRANVDLLHNIDYWLSNLQRADADKNAPIRFKKAVHRLESAVFDFCQYGGASFFQRIVVALGQAERELSVSERFRDDKRIAPLTDLASTWVTAANNGSPEFTLALGLAAIVDTEQRIGPLRANLEAVDWTKRCRSWAEKDRSVVWNSDDLTNNLANVLQRRMMDSKRQGCTRLPLASPFTVNVDTIAAFIEGELDDTRIADLIWGLMLINHRDLNHARQLTSPYEQLSISRAYALLKLLFLPAPLAADRKDGRLLWRFANQDESGILIRPEPRILPLLRNGSVGEACRIAAQRLRSSGLPPIPGSLPNGKTRDDCWKEVANDIHYGQRLAAALLIPIDSRTLHDLILLVCRNQSTAGKALNNIEKEK